MASQMVLMVKESTFSEGDLSLILGSGRFSGINLGFPGSTSSKESACQCRRHKRCGVYPCVGRSAGVCNGNPLQFSCLENSIDRGAWWSTAHRFTKSQTWLNMFTNTHTHTWGDKLAQAIQALNLLLRTCSKPKVHSQAASWSRKTACSRLPLPVIIIRFIVSVCMC